MRQYLPSVLFGMALYAMPSLAQNTYPFPSSGNVGIGTTSPSTTLDVTGDIGISTGNYLRAVSGANTNLNYIQLYDANGGMNFYTYYGIGVPTQGHFSFYPAQATTPALSIRSNGAVGVGTASPTGQFNVVPALTTNPTTASQIVLGGNTGGLTPANFNVGGNQIIIQASSYTNAFNGHGANSVSIAGGNITASPGLGSAGIYGGGVSIFGGNATGASNTGTSAYGGGVNIQGGTGSANYGYVGAVALQSAGGNVGIGTSSPGAKLEVSGNIKLTSGIGASMTYSDGTVQSTAWNGTTCGGDYAESIDVTGDRKAYEPGDVLVIDPKVEGKFLKSSEAYATTVMGIYSTQPGLTGRRVGAPKTGEEVPMAMLGIVPTKVSAENGPIKPGDLLVSSSTPGYAMKGTDHSRMMGALIGKALGHLDSGTGVIEVGIALQ